MTGISVPPADLDDLRLSTMLPAVRSDGVLWRRELQARVRRGGHQSQLYARWVKVGRGNRRQSPWVRVVDGRLTPGFADDQVLLFQRLAAHAVSLLAELDPDLHRRNRHTAATPDVPPAPHPDQLALF